MWFCSEALAVPCKVRRPADSGSWLYGNRASEGTLHHPGNSGARHNRDMCPRSSLRNRKRLVWPGFVATGRCAEVATRWPPSRQGLLLTLPHAHYTSTPEHVGCITGSYPRGDGGTQNTDQDTELKLAR